MKLTLFSPTTLSTLLLPAKCAGQRWICGLDSSGATVQIVAVEGMRSVDGSTPDQWVIKSNSRYQIIGRDGSIISKIPLEYLTVYMILSSDGKTEYRLYSEPLTIDRKTYRVYEVLGENAVFQIGRSPECDIRYANTYVGKHHASLHLFGPKMSVTDNDSLNRTFVNGQAIRHSELRIGDVIHVMGMQIIVTKRFLYINNPDEKVTVQSRYLREYHAPSYTLPQPERNEEEPDAFDDFYYRAPRFKHDIEPFVLKLDAPPSEQAKDSMPMAMSIGPSVTMGMASATTAAFSVVNAASTGNISAAIPSIVMSLGMLSGTLLWPTLTKFYQRKNQEQKEAARQAAYSSYLSQMEQRISEEINHQEQILRRNDGTSSDYLHRVVAQPPQIWERTPKHSDFLQLRLGFGNLPMKADIQYPERRFSVETDNLTEAMYQFGEKEYMLNNVPICLSLTDRFVCGIYSDHAQLLSYAKDLILQITALHSYDEVKLAVLYDKSDEDALSFVRWLPHTMDNHQSVRYIATTPEEAKALSGDLDTIIEHRKTLPPDQLNDVVPHFVVICLSKKLAVKTQCLRSLLESKESIRFSMIAMYERLKDLPKECSAVINLNPSGSSSTLTLLNDVCDSPFPFRPDDVDSLDMGKVTDVLSNTILDIGSTAFQLPKKYSFFEMLDVGMAEHLNLLENWSTSDPTKSLAAPIGIDTYGDLFYLDLHERAHGPHGLVAGMTGSGKSETIISYILSMAIHYHPNEVAFILIDYKGGGMAKAFENIPHTAGIITNLDGNEINRSLVSMQSELHRRELIFQKVSKQYGISNIDIYKYQKLYREGKVTEPLPHLIIVSDEFAELKKDQPDFMTALTSTARVGRSLGVHLILATQKPGGVVDDQIRSNSRFRLCLKVQDRGDSTEMMGRPEAASLVDTGRFYLQVGNNEVFGLGQSAWAGAPYYPAPKALKELDDSLCVIDTNGRILAEVNTDHHSNQKDAPKQLDVITKYICQVSEDEHIRRWKMWLDPIPGRICLDQVIQTYDCPPDSGFALNPVVGVYDDPVHQSQGPLRVPLTADGNVIVYGSSGSGKAMFLESMCCSLMRDHSPSEVNLYILDFGAETMTAFLNAPHVGDVVLGHEAEKVENLFKLLQGRLQTRKKLFAQCGGSFDLYNEQAAVKEPNIVVMINNYAHFSELYENQVGDLAYLTREGNRCGIYFVLTCTGVNNVRLNLQQNFKTLYCLQMNNSADYSVILGKTGGLTPGKHKGRGMVRFSKDSVLEFQTALVTQDESPYPFFRQFCQDLAVRYPGQRTARIPMLPEVVSEEFLSHYVNPADLSRVPVGVVKDTLDICRLDLAARPAHMVVSQAQEWMQFTDSLAQLLAAHYGRSTILLAPNAAAADYPNIANLRVCTTANACIGAVNDIFQQVLVRNNTYKDALAEGKPAPEFEPLFVVVRSVSQLSILLESSKASGTEASDDTPMMRFSLAVEKCARNYQVYFILADNAQQMRTVSSQPWCKDQLSKQDFIWLGSGLNAQYWLSVNKQPQGSGASIPKSFGFMVRNGEATLVKFLQGREN